MQTIQSALISNKKTVIDMSVVKAKIVKTWNFEYWKFKHAEYKNIQLRYNDFEKLTKQYSYIQTFI